MADSDVLPNSASPGFLGSGSQVRTVAVVVGVGGSRSGGGSLAAASQFFPHLVLAGPHKGAFYVEIFSSNVLQTEA